MKKLILNRTECATLRGFAILAIMMHNYCHFFSFTIKENEYTFKGYYNHYLWEHIFSLNKNILLDLFSFFGHYGVPVFLFISGYGLVKKYETSSLNVSSTSFIYKHYLKLLSLMIVGYIMYIFIDILKTNSFRYSIWEILGQLTMTINFYKNPDEIIKPGPYWYFGLMLQLYAIYRIFFYRKSNMIPLLFVIGCWGIQMFYSDNLLVLNWLRYNFIGSVLTFVAGIYYARFPVRDLNIITYIAIFLLFTTLVCLSGGVFSLWIWIPLFIVISVVCMIKLIPAVCMRPITWLGGISASLFVVHPLMRPLFLPISNAGYTYTGLILYASVSIIVAWIYERYIYCRLTSLIRKVIKARSI